MASTNSFDTRDALDAGGSRFAIHRLTKLGDRVARLPFSLRVLLENLLRREDGRSVTKDHVEAVLAWDPAAAPSREIPFMPARVILQDFTGVPCVVDLAAMRDAMVAMGGDPARINPLAPVDLVIDHSVQVDRFGSSTAFRENVDIEYQRNRERYAFLRWGQQAFSSFRVVPPGTGIVHQVNLEYLAPVVATAGSNGQQLAYPDTVLGTDSHTTMINGLGVVGWGVGGIEAEAAMLGQATVMLVPQVVGFKLTGRLAEGATATDVVLTCTEMLRKRGVVGKFVEFFGPGIAHLAVADRATIANMAPEYGATIGYFPVDDETLAYLRLSGRDDARVALAKAYYEAQGLFRTAGTPDPEFTDRVELDLGTVVPSLAGPKRPQDRVPLAQMKSSWEKARGEYFTGKVSPDKTVPVTIGGATSALGHGAVVIAAITSCTNTSNPSVMLAAGLLAKKAVARGLRVKPWVKTSLAPGSKVVTRYLQASGTMAALETLGFNLVGYGCTTCIGNSGPLPEPVAAAIEQGDLAVAAVLSGNRNFEGRVNPLTRANYLASPPLVVAYALAGTVDWDPATEPIGTDQQGKLVSFKDIWPSNAEVMEAVKTVTASLFRDEYGRVFEGDEHWRGMPVPTGDRYAWEATSTYIKKPPFFDGMAKTPGRPTDIRGARCLALLGDSITTDHISPAGSIKKESPAGRYLESLGVTQKDFNSYGARRGNHEVMMRGTFANIRIKNQLVPGVEGGVTVHLPTGQQLAIYDAAMLYKKDGTPLVVIAGKEYGTGSSRDWAAKGTLLLGVQAVITESYERIHRSNLVGMGVLPLEFQAGQNAASLGLTGRETFAVGGIAEGLKPGKKLTVTATAEDGTATTFTVTARVDTPDDVEYYRHGGLLPYVLRGLVGATG
jgi:aconitate hydratase